MSVSYRAAAGCERCWGKEAYKHSVLGRQRKSTDRMPLPVHECVLKESFLDVSAG